MALIDVSDLLLDPDFIDKMQLVHRAFTVNSKGENQLAETVIPTVGSIQPATGKELQRLPDDLQLRDVRTFWIKAEIVTDGSGKYPDVLVFKGKRFQVLTTNPWLNWGQGWNQGLCVGEKPS